MIDLSGLPLPADAPAAGRCVRIERLQGGLVRLVLDPPHRKHTVLDLALIRDLDLALDQLGGNQAVLGLVIAGREPLHFAFGADLDMIEAATDPLQVERAIKCVHAVFARLENFPCPTVAAVGGVVPGGAFELCLACDHIVLADDPGTRIGLPETQLGILPAWGGTHRLSRRIGPLAALPLILQGRLLRARDAKRKGLVDRLAHPSSLDKVAADIALGRVELEHARRRVARLLIDRNPLATRFIARSARRQALRKTHGHYPAIEEVITLVTQAARTSTQEAATKEAQAGARLATGPVCKSLISLFRASEAAKKLGQLADGRRAAATERATVVGAGVMGAGIAGLLAEKGLTVRLSDISQDGLDRALFEHQKSVAQKEQRRQLARHEADAALDRLTGTTDLSGIRSSDLVVEAIAERLDVKRTLLAQVAAAVRPDCILATNTSSLSVTEIARGLPQPERIVGMHFFNPVAKMPLVEIIAHTEAGGSDPAVVARVAALALRCGKTPVVVRDVAGFLVNRILGPYLDEALRLGAMGVNLLRIDRLMIDFGMPMGPFRLLDEVGFDIAVHAAQSLHEAYGARMTPTSALDKWIERGQLGKKSGRGFYKHLGKGGKKLSGDALARHNPFGVHSQPVFSDQELVDRCTLAMLGEAVRCLAEGVVASARELDLAAVFGTGFAPFRGGPLRYADQLGAAEVVRRLDAILNTSEVTSRGEASARFEAAPLLRDMAASGARFCTETGQNPPV